jgi:radical SAM protein with 4Fe4S-binding SPASM domain
MSEQMRLDSHKLMFHPREVAKWLAGEDIFPLYVEISPTGSCNHRCLFCALDYLEYSPRFLDGAMLRERIAEMGQLGVKSIMFGGEGEPLLHGEIGTLIVHTKASGIDAALTTNGVLLTPELFRQIAPATSWIKVSLNAGTAATYAAVHRTREDDFERVFANISAAAGLVSGSNSTCTLGVQAILLPENASEMELLAERARDAGARYLVVKSYSQHQRSATRRYEKLDYEPLLALAERLQRLSNDRFQVVVRLHSMRKLQNADRGYGRCLALPFWSYVDAGGSVWGCSAFIGDERFRYGSLYEQNFADIWRGEKRRHSLEMVAQCLDPEECRRNCRMDEINRYLWELTHPHEHVNFI